MTADITPLGDLAQRLREKAEALDDVAKHTSAGNNRSRLRGKAAGVHLALSFVEEAIREQNRQHDEWVRRTFLGSSSSLTDDAPPMQTWNADV